MSNLNQGLDKILILREATEADSKEIWQWRNCFQTRAMSIATDEVSWEHHVNWYSTSLNSPSRFLYLGLLSDKEKVGLCRFDIIGNIAEISINLNPAFRKMGLSASLLFAAIKHFNKKYRMDLTATIKHTNAASILCFTKCGFVLSHQDSEYQHFRLTKEDVAWVEK